MRKEKKTKINLKETFVTPDLASKWLDSSIKNRGVRKEKVSQYCDLMRNNLWRTDTGEPIMFDRHGSLIDGQHRLLAVVQNQRPVWMLVMTGVADDSFEWIGQGAPRSCADILHAQGEINAATLATSLRYLYCYQAGKLFWCNGGAAKLHNHDAANVLQNHPDLRKSVSFVHSIVKGAPKIVAKSVAAFCHYMGQKKYQEKSNRFWTHILTSTEIPTIGPIYLLHDRLMRNMVQRAKLTQRDIIALSIKAWNSFASGQQMKILKWSLNEDAPKFIE